MSSGPIEPSSSVSRNSSASKIPDKATVHMAKISGEINSGGVHTIRTGADHTRNFIVKNTTTITINHKVEFPLKAEPASSVSETAGELFKDVISEEIAGEKPFHELLAKRPGTK